MATYNGEKFIKRQIESILPQLSPNDELIISDDGSTDNTMEIIHEFHDLRIKTFQGPKKGFVKNFENAVKNSSGDIIFLCDQDDYWYPNKVKTICNIFDKKDCVLVEHDAVVKDVKGNVLVPSFFAHRNAGTGVIKNVMKCSYHGCLIAFRSSLIKEIMPFPNHGCFHDQWIGIIADYTGKIYFCQDKLMDYIRHESNVSGFKKLPLLKQIYMRLTVVYYMVKYLIRKKSKDNISTYYSK